MKTSRFGFATILAFGLSASAIASQTPPATQAAPAGSELVYETFCKKDEKEKRRLFRAATPDQKAAMARTQIERWLNANRAELSQEQQAVLEELLKTLSPVMFEPTEEGRIKQKSFEARASSVFRGVQLDEMGPSGPCIAQRK